MRLGYHGPHLRLRRLQVRNLRTRFKRLVRVVEFQWQKRCLANPDSFIAHLIQMKPGILMCVAVRPEQK